MTKPTEFALEGTPIRSTTMVGGVVVSGGGGTPGGVPIDNGDGTGTWGPPAASGLVSVTDGTTTISPTTILTVPAHSLSGSTPNAAFDWARLHIITASGASQAISLVDGDVHDVTLTANCTFTLAGATTGRRSTLTLVLRQGGSGSYTVTWPGSVQWQDPLTGLSGAAAPALFTAVGAEDIIELISHDGGTTWGGSSGAGATTLALLGDVSLSSLANADRLRYSTTDSKWHNSALIWRPVMALDASGNYLPVTTGGGDAMMVEA